MSRAAEKLRKQQSFAGSVYVYIRTSPFREQDPFYSNGMTIPVSSPTNDTMQLVNLSLIHIFGFKFAWWMLVLSALVILLIGEFTQIDFVIEDFYYDSTLKTFPWKNAWFAKILMHVYIKNLILSCGFLLYLILLIDLFKPMHIVNSWFRFRLRFVATASVVIPVTLSLLKKHSVLHLSLIHI